MIYFMQSIGGGPVKIGCSGNIEHRRYELESKYGEKLAVLATIKGDRKKEREIHERFSHLRFGHTEQFRPASELMEFIGRPLLVSPNPEAVEAMDDRHGETVVVRGNPEWREWLRELAEHEGMTTAGLLDHAVRKYARMINFREPPNRKK